MDLIIDDMPNEDMRIVAELCGIDNTVLLMRKMGGVSIYIPKNPFHLYLTRTLTQSNSQPNFKRLAVELGVSERYVRKVWTSINNN